MKNLKYEILKNFDDCYVHVCDIIGDKGTTNITLNNLCKKLFGDRFVGVFCADEYIRLKDNECCIVNSDPSTKSGLHWCALYKHKLNKYKSVIYFFDSFGRNPSEVSKYFKNKKWVPIELNRIESYRSSNCGELSVTFLLIFDKYKTKCIGVI